METTCIESKDHSSKRFAYRTILVAFFLSGFTAILYQVIWQRMLGFFSGVDLYSATIIIASYMAGLGLGSLVGGHVADRLSPSKNILLFAITQVAVGCFALLSTGFYYDFLYSRHPELSDTTWILALVLFVSLVVPTFLMGLSLPCLSKALIRTIDNAAERIGGLYGINTLGAAFGALTTTWVFMRIMSFEHILFLGAIVNIVVALGAVFVVYKGFHSVREKQPFNTANTPCDRGISGDKREKSLTFIEWVCLTFMSGFVALSLEIIWLRIVGIIFKDTSVTFGTLVGIDLLGLAFGTLLGILTVSKTPNPTKRYFIFQIAICVYSVLVLVMLIAFIRFAPQAAIFRSYLGSPDVLSAFRLPIRVDNGTLWISLYVLLPIVLVGPPTVLMGLSFLYLQKAVQRDVVFLGRKLGVLQTVNMMGSMAGAIVTGCVLLQYFGTSGILKAIVMSTSILFVFLYKIRPLRSIQVNRAFVVTSVLTIVGLYALIPGARIFWGTFHGVSNPDEVSVVEDGTGVTLLKNDAREAEPRFIMFVNGRDASWVPYGGIHSFLGVLPVLVHPNPQDIAMIGLGSGDTMFHLGGRLETQHITSIELVRTEMQALVWLNKQYAYAPLSSMLMDRRFAYVSADARQYLMRSQKRYDVIETDTLWADTAYSGNLYSLEYFTLLKNHLNTHGIIMCWLPTLRSRDTFVKVFPYVIILKEYALGSNEPMLFDRKILHERLNTVFTLDYYSQSTKNMHEVIDSYIDELSIRDIGLDFDRSQLKDVNTDLFPKDEFSATPIF